jgi:primosomal replication protein N
MTWARTSRWKSLRVATNRVELSGRLIGEPELRITPAGTPVLRILVECGDDPERLTLGVVMAGEQGRTAFAALKRGGDVEVGGRLRMAMARAAGGAGVEVVATRIEGRI